MVTLCLTDFLADYPDVMVVVHNLGGNIPYEVERMDHRCLLDTPDEELPSSRFRKAKVYVDCNSFGPHSIEAAVRLYGAERIVCGTDGTEFGCDWTGKALAEARDRRGGARADPAPQRRCDARPRKHRAARSRRLILRHRTAAPRPCSATLPFKGGVAEALAASLHPTLPIIGEGFVSVSTRILPLNSVHARAVCSAALACPGYDCPGRECR